MARTNSQSKDNIQKVVNIYSKWANPLRYLNNTEIERMLESARFGCDEKLQLAFYEIERQSPIYSICIQKRVSGITNREWDITPIDESEEAKAQAQAVKEMFQVCDTKNKNGLTEAIRHLALASFRGRSAVKPFIDENGDLILKKLDNWNFLSFNARNYWNPNSSTASTLGADADGFLKGEGIVELPEYEVAYVEEERPIDIPGLMVYLRMLIGEDNWARAIEKYGIAQVLLKVPAGTPDTDLQKWDYRAQAIYEGASGSVPAGTEVDVLSQVRDQDPFSGYIRHQMEMVAIMATGSTLATLGGTSGATGAGMGSNLAETQNEQFIQLINQDAKKISNAITDCIVRKCVHHLFGYGKNILCRFNFVEQDDTTIEEYLSYAEKAKALGLTIDVQELKRLTKLSFISDKEASVWSPSTDEQTDEVK